MEFEQDLGNLPGFNKFNIAGASRIGNKKTAVKTATSHKAAVRSEVSKTADAIRKINAGENYNSNSSSESHIDNHNPTNMNNQPQQQQQQRQTISSIDQFRQEMINSGNAGTGDIETHDHNIQNNNIYSYPQQPNNNIAAGATPMGNSPLPQEQAKMHYVEMMNRANKMQRQYTVPNIHQGMQQQQQQGDGHGPQQQQQQQQPPFAAPKRAASLNISNLQRKRVHNNEQDPVPPAEREAAERGVLFGTMPYPMRKYIADMAKHKIYELVETGNVTIEQILNQNYWEPVIDSWFSPTSTCTISKTTQNTNRHFMYLTKMFPAMCQFARYLNVSRFEAYPNQVFTQVLSNDTIFFSCLRLTFRVHYKDGSYVTHYSQFKGVFNREFKIDWMDFVIHSFVPGIEWSALENAIANPSQNSHISEHSIPIDPFNSHIQEKMSKSKDESRNTTVQKFATITQLRSNFDIFRNISAIGVHNDVVRALQINEIMSDLKAVRIYQRKYGIGSPLEAMRAFVDNNSQHLPPQATSPRFSQTSPHGIRTASVPVGGATATRENILKTENTAEHQHYNHDDLWQLYPSEQQSRGTNSPSGKHSDGSPGSANRYSNDNVPSKRQKF